MNTLGPITTVMAVAGLILCGGILAVYYGAAAWRYLAELRRAARIRALLADMDRADAEAASRRRHPSGRGRA